MASNRGGSFEYIFQTGWGMSIPHECIWEACTTCPAIRACSCSPGGWLQNALPGGTKKPRNELCQEMARGSQFHIVLDGCRFSKLLMGQCMCWKHILFSDRTRLNFMLPNSLGWETLDVQSWFKANWGRLIIRKAMVVVHPLALTKKQAMLLLALGALLLPRTQLNLEDLREIALHSISASGCMRWTSFAKALIQN